MDISKTMGVASKLLEYEGFRVSKITPTRVVGELTLSDGDVHEFEISGELCMCHGGRLSISVGPWHHRIGYDYYVEGRDTPELEILYAIDEDMIPTIENLINYTYVVESRRTSGDKTSLSKDYVRSDYELVRYLTDGSSDSNWSTPEDIEVGYRYQYPNPKMSSVITSKSVDVHGNISVSTQKEDRDELNKSTQAYSEWRLDERFKSSMVATSYKNESPKRVLVKLISEDKSE